MRPVFSDGLNSLAHVAIGLAAVRLTPLLFAGFVAYEVLTHNVLAETLPAFVEFAAGAALGIVTR